MACGQGDRFWKKVAVKGLMIAGNGLEAGTAVDMAPFLIWALRGWRTGLSGFWGGGRSRTVCVSATAAITVVV